eukprot:TRINITY_DN4866_c0_g1_i1.p1 TRINITY_DN4866_c0_g1~~TRINITY_DN4866_c0_g1_i1.p1  ORF type:complete len:148 (-),score=44.06 TRINITY_DN4866_c0_g1_i1:81-524(-)
MALQQLARKAKQMSADDISALRELIVEIPNDNRKRSMSSSESEAGPSKYEDPVAKQRNAKDLQRDVLREFDALKKRLAKYRGKSEHREVYISPQYNKIAALLDKVESNIKQIQAYIDDDNWTLADDLVWQSGVDIESVKNMIQVVVD